jgi:hypothetical protein
MELEKGTKYTLPEDAEPSWFAQVLGEERRIRVSPVRINLHLRKGTTVPGALDSTDPEHGDYGRVYLENPANEDELWQLPCEAIAGFTLMPDPPLGRSDELRAG